MTGNFTICWRFLFISLVGPNSHLFRCQRPKHWTTNCYCISISKEWNTRMKSHLDFLLKFEIIHWNMHANGRHSSSSSSSQYRILQFIQLFHLTLVTFIHSRSFNSFHSTRRIYLLCISFSISMLTNPHTHFVHGAAWLCRQFNWDSLE